MVPVKNHIEFKKVKKAPAKATDSKSKLNLDNPLESMLEAKPISTTGVKRDAGKKKSSLLGSLKKI